MATRADFEHAVRRARREALLWDRTAVKRIDKILAGAARRTLRELRRHAGTGKLQEAYQHALLTDIGRVLDDLKGAYGELFNINLLGSAQITATREARFAQLVLPQAEYDEAAKPVLASLTQEATIADVGRVQVSFGLVSRDAVEAAFRRVQRDGLTLSDRLWRLGELTRQEMGDRVVGAIARGTSARDLAKEMKGYLTDQGRVNARYNSMRLARTEINTIGRDAHVLAATEPTGVLKPWIRGMKWMLSQVHVAPDICDIWASQDVNGLGPGIYLPEHLPVDHSNGRCSTTNVLTEGYEQEQVTQPQPGAVSDAAKKYYGIPVDEQSKYDKIRNEMGRLNNEIGIIEDARMRGSVKQGLAERLATKLEADPDFVDYTRRHWAEVDISDIFGEPKVTKAALEKASRGFIDSWAITSGDNDEIAIAMQLAAKQEFKIRGSAVWWDPSTVAKARGILAQDGAGMRSFLRAMHEDTQTWFKQRNIKSVQLFRGLNFDEVPKQLKGLSWTGKVEKLNMASQPLSSYSSDCGLAQYFVHAEARVPYQAVIRTEVPIDRVISTCNTGFGAKNFGEVVVAGGRERAEIIGWTPKAVKIPRTGDDLLKTFAGVKE